jgi:hypothetical protein
LWYFLAALAKELVIRSQNSLYEDLGRLAGDVRFSVEIRDGSLNHYLPFKRPERWPTWV